MPSSGLHALLYLAIAPFVGLLSLLVIKWDPTHVDVDSDDYEAAGPVADASSLGESGIVSAS